MVMVMVAQFSHLFCDSFRNINLTSQAIHTHIRGIRDDGCTTHTTQDHGKFITIKVLLLLLLWRDDSGIVVVVVAVVVVVVVVAVVVVVVAAAAAAVGLEVTAIVFVEVVELVVAVIAVVSADYFVLADDLIDLVVDFVALGTAVVGVVV